MTAFLVLFLTHYIFNKQNEEKRFIANDLKQRKIVLNTILQNDKEQMLKLVDDYSLWDEMVAFTKKHDNTWAEENIKPIIDLYHYDFVWIFDKNDHNVFFCANPKINSLDIFTENILSELQKKQLQHFYQNSKDRFIELAGATIHSSMDDKRETEPQGFLIIGRQFTASYLNSFAAQTDYNVTILDTVSQNEDFAVKIDYKLKDIFENEIATLRFSTDNLFFSSLHKKISNSILFLIGSSILFLVFLFLILQFWIYKPLKLISKSLQTKSLDHLEPMMKANHEFGEISRILNHYKIQTEQLQNEMKATLKAKKMFLETNDRFYKIFEHSPDLIIILNPSDNTILEANLTFFQTTGYDSTELTEIPLDKLIIPWEINFSPEKEYELLSKKNQNVPVLISEETIEFDKKKCRLFMLKNILQKKIIEKRMLQTQKMEAIGTLARGISHDFNNILNIILGYTENLKKRIPEDSSYHDQLDLIKKAAHRANDLVDQILTISKQSETKFTKIQLHNIIVHVYKLVRASLPSSISISTFLQSEDYILGNATQIHQILMNLLTNAFQAIEDKTGMISIRLFPTNKDQSICLEIEDSGKGIDEKIVNRIFDPYFTTKSESGGYGLGLAIVKAIVEKHNGKIDVKSRKGKGTIFALVFPIFKPIPLKDVTSEGIISTTHRSILLIEDESDLLELFRDAFIDNGWDVIAQTDSRIAFDHFLEHKNSIDIVVTDVSMPNMNGVELIKNILNYKPDMPVIMYSGYKTKEVQNLLHIFPKIQYFSKPVLPEQIVKHINRIFKDE